MMGLTEIGYLTEVEELLLNAEQELSAEDFKKLLDNIAETVIGYCTNK